MLTYTHSYTIVDRYLCEIRQFLHAVSRLSVKRRLTRFVCSEKQVWCSKSFVCNPPPPEVSQQYRPRPDKSRDVLINQSGGPVVVVSGLPSRKYVLGGKLVPVAVTVLVLELL